MTARQVGFPDALADYYETIACQEHPLLARLRAETQPMPQAGMQIGPAQGVFMGMLARVAGVRRYLEIGTFTGYSALAMALAMPADGRLTCLDVSEDWTAIARRYWAEAGVADKIELRLAPAIETLAALRAEDGPPGRYDMAFIDADKSNYAAYFEHCLTLVRRGGLILFDNMLWSGKVADPAVTDADTETLRTLNAALHADERVESVLLPLGDGLTLARVL